MGRATAPPFHSWEKARDRALFLAHASGRVHRVKSVEPTAEWPWHRWRVEKTTAYVVARQQLQAGTRLQRRIDQAVGSHVPGPSTLTWSLRSRNASRTGAAPT